MSVDQIRSRILQAGITQDRVAREARISSTVLSRVLRGLRDMPDGFEERVLAAIDLLEKADQAAEKERQRVLEGTEAD